jgi:hypothetical protein
MGIELRSLFYRDDVIIEHLHPAAGKADNDSGYVEVNSSAIFNHDRNAYANYWATEKASDLEKLLND